MKRLLIFIGLIVPICGNGQTAISLDGNATNLNYVDVKEDYGANGNGSTDDRAAIQNAIDNNAFIYIPEGTYILSSALHIDKNIIIKGAGKETTILKLTGSVTDNVIETSLTAGIDYFEISNLTIDGNKANQTSASNDTTQCGIRIMQNNVDSMGSWHLHDMVIKNCERNGLYLGKQRYLKNNIFLTKRVENVDLFNNDRNGVQTGDYCEYVIFNNVNSYSNYYGFYFNGSSNMQINNCSAILNTSHGFYLTQGHNTSKNIFTGCVSNHNYNSGFYVVGCADVNINGCQVQANSQYGIYFYNNTRLSSITGNTIASNGQGTTNTYAEIILNTNCDSNIISNNIVKAIAPARTKYGIAIYSADCSGNILNSNTVSGSDSLDYYFHADAVGNSKVYQNSSGIDISWQDAGAFFTTDTVYYWLPLVNNTALTTGSYTLNKLRAYPIYVPKDFVFDSYGIDVTTGVAGGELVMGIYTDNNFYPDTLVFGTDTINCNAAAVIRKDALPAPYIKLYGKRVYWFVINTNSTTIAIRAGAVGSLPNIMGWAAGGSGYQAMGYTVDRNYDGTLPNPFPAKTGATALLNAALPLLFLKQK